MNTNPMILYFEQPVSSMATVAVSAGDLLEMLVRSSRFSIIYNF